MTTSSSSPPEPQEDHSESNPVETTSPQAPQVPQAAGKAAPPRYAYSPAGQAAPAHYGPYYPQAGHPVQAPPGQHAPQASGFSPQQFGLDLSKKSKSTTMVTIGNFSLFAIVLNLVLLGGFTFLGGFLVGLWVGGPGPYFYRGSGAFPQGHSSVPPISSSPSQTAGHQSSHVSEIAREAGDAAAGAISTIQPQQIPAFLMPLANDIQGVAEKEAAQKAQEAVQHIIEPSSKPHHSDSPHSSLSPSHHKGYAVQLGVFATHENAKDLQKRMQGLNYKTYVKKTHLKNEGVAYRVHSGHYDTYTKATHAASQFKEASIPGATVVNLHEDDQSGS